MNQSIFPDPGWQLGLDSGSAVLLVDEEDHCPIPCMPHRPPNRLVDLLHAEVCVVLVASEGGGGGGEREGGRGGVEIPKTHLLLEFRIV